MLLITALILAIFETVALYNGYFATVSLVILIISLLVGWLFYSPTHYKISDAQRGDNLVVIVGGGFSGICAAVKLKEQNLPFIIIEQAPSIGGTWWYNKYPGCSCDVPSHIYSFSFYKFCLLYTSPSPRDS